MPVLVHPRAPTCATTRRLVRLRHPTYSTSSVLLAAPRRSQYFNSGFTTSYDPNQETSRGPIFSKATFGVPQFYPRDLKRRVDDYVVGQDRAKKTICAVIFNHYQGLRRRQHHEIQDQRLREKLQRQRYAQDRDAFEHAGYNSSPAHPVEDEFPGHHESVRGTHAPTESVFEPPRDDFYIPEDFAAPRHVKIDKSNLLLIGPTGVGKTYILETLSKKLNVPFTISDCNSFTQAGYIGQDVETCIERLLIEANYDIKAAEHGIVVLDEFDKIAKRETVNGRDVGGEGVQQALLKLVEGTKVTVNIKDHRSSRTTSNPPGSYGPSSPQSSPPPGKVDQYTVDTTNILFVFCGAFVGLDKIVMRRVSKPSIGFGSEIRGRGSSMSSLKDVLPPEMYSHLPHQPVFTDGSSSSSSFTPLDLTTPADLQAFGFIPELIGRLHNICALTPLSLDELYRILTEPRNSLVAQYTALFETYPSKLFFTRRALYAIAERAAKNETGARGLKMEMERVLAEPMFDAPTPYVLITEGCVNGTEKAIYWGKDGRMELERRMQEEDEKMTGTGEPDVTFEQFREAGLSGA
ncbi:P-loop containing nucleoside triphosphate hydrolase protein [Canariomyces notabilis]|uniref:P-loop containing nucleoside triphosphate hydrolase protein n=1 Tax=Canariomyces notabilis TaxID=2074819 RepID=A0AAN6TKB7_9PEZI|nr:P-loop containing nucleoside triphosphate hydrolase protein [Canariomyces arenarius]